MNDPFKIVLNSLESLKNDISRLYEKYYEMNKEIWIKLTEIETRVANQENKQQAKTIYWRWIIPVAISLLALIIALLEFLRKIFN